MAMEQLPRSIRITDAFEGGNIDVLDSSNPSNILLAIKSDPFCQNDNRAHYQWFYFAITGAAGVPLTCHITNAGGASYPEAWPGTQAVHSYDLITWRRTSTTYNATTGTLTISFTPEKQHVRVAYFAPYSNQQVDQLVALLQCVPGVQLHPLMPSVEGRPLYLLQWGGRQQPPATSQQQQQQQQRPLRLWLLARQHPGEPQGSFFIDEFLNVLATAAAALQTESGGPGDQAAAAVEPAPAATLGAAGPAPGGVSAATVDGASEGVLSAAKCLLQQAQVFVVPNMCPDGVARGHLRTNAAGANLNREWAAPCPRRSPEVAGVAAALAAAGCDFLLDVHGDEEVPGVFVSGLEGLTSWGPRLQALQRVFVDALLKHSSTFQTQLGYGAPAPNSANLAICAKAVAARYSCLALTLEMPFKDAACAPDPDCGWSPARCRQLAREVVLALVDLLPLLQQHRTSSSGP